jgi:hypothetical protein
MQTNAFMNYFSSNWKNLAYFLEVEVINGNAGPNKSNQASCSQFVLQ